MPSNHLILCCPLLLPSIFARIRVFSESVLCIRWPKCWRFSFKISPSNDYSGLVSFRTDWFDLLVAHRTLKSLLQYHSWKASVLWRSTYFMVQFSYPYMILEKPWLLATDLCWQSDVSGFLMFVIAILPRSKCLLISWLQSQSTLILEPKRWNLLPPPHRLVFKCSLYIKEISHFIYCKYFFC